MIELIPIGLGEHCLGEPSQESEDLNGPVVLAIDLSPGALEVFDVEGIIGPLTGAIWYHLDQTHRLTYAHVSTGLQQILVDLDSDR